MFRTKQSRREAAVDQARAAAAELGTAAGAGPGSLRARPA